MDTGGYVELASSLIGKLDREPVTGVDKGRLMSR